MRHLSQRKAALAVFLLFFICGCARNSINIATRKQKTAPPVLERMRAVPVQPFANMLQTIPLERDRVHMRAQLYWLGYLKA